LEYKYKPSQAISQEMSVTINMSDIISKAFAMGASGKELTAEFILELLKDVPVVKKATKKVASEGEEVKKAGGRKKAVLAECDMCMARVFTKKHLDESGKLLVNEEATGHAHNKFGGRCTKSKKEGEFCATHAKDPKMGIWDGDAEGALRKKILDEARGIFKAPRKGSIHSDVESEGEDAPKVKRNPKKKAEKVESDVEKPKKKSMEEIRAELADVETEPESEAEVVSVKLVKKELDGFSWMVDEVTGEVYGKSGERMSDTPIGKMSVKKEFKKWLQAPACLVDEEDDE